MRGMQRLFARIALALTMACCLFLTGVAGLFSAVPAYASDLAVVESAPVSDEQNAPVKGRYWVRFTNNVASVEGNAKCVSLRTEDGKKVAASKYAVQLPNVQRDFGYRQYIFIKVKGLDAGKEYRIRIEGELASKNGSTLEQGVEIPFKTAAAGKKAVELAKPESVVGGSGGGGGNGSGGASSQGGAAGSAQSASSSAPGSQGGQGTSDVAVSLQPTPAPAGAIVVGVVVLVVIVVALVFDTKRRKKNAKR